MDPVLLARFQFAMTIGFHYVFPPITIGLAWIIAWFMMRWWRTGKEIYETQARFWLKLFAINFAVGVATGITMEFQFGTNWAVYSRFVGDIFGAPLAAEGLMAFFLESTFMGVLLFGWRRLSRRTLWLSSMLVALGSTLSAFWIIVANSWMQTPAGYRLANGRAELDDFWEAVFNPSTIPRYLHTVDAAIITGAFFMLGTSAWYLWKRRHVAFALQSFKVSLLAAFAAAAMQMPLGHLHAVQVGETQPEKLATFEGLFETQTRAPMLLFGLPDAEQKRVRAAIEIPGLLSLLFHGDMEARVQGMNDFPPENLPPLAPTFFSFHLMFMLGIYFLTLTTAGLVLWWKDRLERSPRFMKLVFFSTPLPIVVNELGWISAEVGRQPWMVYHVEGMRVADAVSASVSAAELVFSIIMFGIIYLLLGLLWFFLLRRVVLQGPRPDARWEVSP